MPADESGQLRVTLEFVRAMLAAFKDEQLIHRRYAFEIILQVRGACAVLAGSQAGGKAVRSHTRPASQAARQGLP